MSFYVNSLLRASRFDATDSRTDLATLKREFHRCAGKKYIVMGVDVEVLSPGDGNYMFYFLWTR